MKIDITKDNQLFGDVEPGEYDFEVLKAEVKEVAPGRKYEQLKVVLSLSRDGTKKGQIYDNISAYFAGTLKDLCSAVGLLDVLNQTGEVPVQQMMGKSGKCVIKERKQMTVESFHANESNPQADSFASSDIPF